MSLFIFSDKSNSLLKHRPKNQTESDKTKYEYKKLKDTYKRKKKVARNQPNTFSKQQSKRDSDREPQQMDRLKKFWYRRKPQEKGPSQKSLKQTTLKHKKPGYEDAQELDLKRENLQTSTFSKVTQNQRKA